SLQRTVPPLNSPASPKSTQFAGASPKSSPSHTSHASRSSPSHTLGPWLTHSFNELDPRSQTTHSPSIGSQSSATAHSSTGTPPPPSVVVGAPAAPPTGPCPVVLPPAPEPPVPVVELETPPLPFVDALELDACVVDAAPPLLPPVPPAPLLLVFPLASLSADTACAQAAASSAPVATHAPTRTRRFIGPVIFQDQWHLKARSHDVVKFHA